MNLKKILKEEATWCFLALAGLLILLYTGAYVIIDTYFYMISLNILILLFSYIILKIKNKMHYYSYVVGCAFFAVWFVFYSICDLKSRSLKGYLTKQHEGLDLDYVREGARDLQVKMCSFQLFRFWWS